MRENADRFEGLAETYAVHRPGYPAGLFERLVAACASDRRIAVDVGAGPGTSTQGLRAALPADWLVTAVEPCTDMRRVLSRKFTGDPGVQVIDASAEALPLPAGSAGLVVACGAFEWFDRAAFFAEAARVLAPRGLLAIMRNRRCPVPLLDDFDRYIAAASAEAGRSDGRETPREPTVRQLMAEEEFMGARSLTVRWQDVRDARALVDLYLTDPAVWSIVRRIGLGRVMEDLAEICACHAVTLFEIDWETTLKWAQRRAASDGSRCARASNSST